MVSFLAQALGPLWQSWSVGSVAILIVVIAAVIALVFIALRKFNVQVPDFVVQAFWVIVIAAVIIFAIRIVIAL